MKQEMWTLAKISLLAGWLDSTIDENGNILETVLGRPSAPFIMSDGSMLI